MVFGRERGRHQSQEIALLAKPPSPIMRRGIRSSPKDPPSDKRISRWVGARGPPSRPPLPRFPAAWPRGPGRSCQPTEPGPGDPPHLAS